ncbi:MAG: sulfite reductase [Chlamydiia bacterium]|nr:sulfite reductase [Chlamydiia bacterium]
MFSKTHPYFARIQKRILLTASPSTKKTYHIELEIEGERLPFKVGDSIAVCAQNDPEEVAQILRYVNPSDTLREFLLHKANISRVTGSFLKTYAPHMAPENLNDFLHSHTLLDLFRLYKLEVSAEILEHSLLPLLPRFYSIANSPKVFPNEVHLTVAYVEYMAHGHKRRGVGSHFLCDLAQPHTTPIPIYVQPSHGFTVPADPNASIILVGPGTGIAPFRAFLQERMATHAPGRNWLFFGERHRATDFLYGDYLLALEKQERLRLDLAFSRDGAQKIYVQHKMYEQRKSLWNWLENSAYFYLCGDAEEMAKDVEAMLRTIASEEGQMTPEEARHWLKKLRQEKRFLADVY